MLTKLKNSIIFLLISNSLSAQEMWGISNGNFSGNMGIFLNPTTVVGAPYQYEINLAAFDLFAENDNIYFLQSDKMIYHTLIGYARDGKNFYTRNSGLNNSFGHTLIIGPSYLRNKTTSAWGIHSALRSEASALSVTPETALLVDNRFNAPIIRGDTIITNPYSSAYASWIEIGMTYGKILRESEYHIIKWAANVNLLGGMNGFYLNSRNLKFTSFDSTQLMYYKWNLRATCNFILDYGVHAGNLSKEDAMKLLLDEAFQQKTEAENKWRRVQLTQVQLTSYFNGYTEIYEFRDEMKKKLGDKFNLKEFNEKFLSYGSAPVKYIRELMLKELSTKE